MVTEEQYGYRRALMQVQRWIESQDLMDYCIMDEIELLPLKAFKADFLEEIESMFQKGISSDISPSIERVEKLVRDLRPPEQKQC